MYQHFALSPNEKLNIEELEDFLSEQLNVQIEPDLMRCVLQTLDRDQDGLVSYQELCDAFYGAE